MNKLRTIQSVRQKIKTWRDAGDSVALVPTMGALHEGHLSLVEFAKTRADKVIVSIFVNPAQFGPNEDFERYPRHEDEDCRKLAESGTDLVYLPERAEMYADDASTHISVGGLSEGLCGAHRPGHFDGVALVVCKLLLQVQPDLALFGEKDYQQLCVLRQMVRDLDIPVEIAGGSIVRDEQGLALSSRNAYLSAEQLETARQMNKILFDLAVRMKSEDIFALLEEGQIALREAGFERVEYLELRDATTLQPVKKLESPARLLTAAHLGTTRLIDNVAVEAA